MALFDDVVGLRPPETWQQAGLILASVLVLYQVASVVYNLYFHPLRHYPGPLLQRASNVPWALLNMRGVQPFHNQKLHDKYGPVVRIGPNHLSYTDVRAWKDIYGHQVGNKLHGAEMEKPWPFVRVVDAPDSIVTAGREEHSRLRRALSHGFSDSAMREQEPIIVKYVNQLLARLHQSSNNGKEKLNIEAWYNWTTFDIVGDLVFGQSFGCLDNAEYHPWIAFIFKAVRFGAILSSLGYVGLGAVIPVIVKLGSAALKMIAKYTDDMVKTRLAMERNDDLFEGLVKRRKEWNMSFKQLSSNALILVLAGSETTATTLSGATFLVLSNPEVMRKLKHEVRSRFTSTDEITIQSVSKLTYMLAVLNEALRLYPPVTANLVRKTPPNGATIAGKFVSGGTFVEVQHYSMNHCSDNWADPWEFRPERFLGDMEAAREQGNRLEALQAFSTGPRNCIGKNLAYAEMRLIFARLIFEFDMELQDDSHHWIRRQKAYGLWDRIPLNIAMTPTRTTTH